MNKDLETTEYIAKLQDITLSEQSKTRIQAQLTEYVSFHSVRADGSSRLIKQVPLSTSLFSLKFVSMPFIILIALMITGGTSLAASSSVPGDFLYPVKISFNENIRSAFAVSADSEADLQADLLEERIAEAQELQAEGRLSGEVAKNVSGKITAQTKRATLAAQNSSSVVALASNNRIKAVLESFLGTSNLDSALAAEVSTSLMASDLATGEYDINAYRADMKARTTALASLVQQNKANLEAKVYADVSVKIDSATKLTAEAQTQVEADARVTLDKAATLAGEVESKLSTLGQVEIDSNTGIITDIDFSIDPMIIDRGDGNESSPTGSSSTSGQAGGGVNSGVDIDTSLEGSIDSEIIDTGVESETSVKGGVSLEL
jgi:hypothetical protein